MSLDLTATRLEYRLHDESGYDFKIDCYLDPEWGWYGEVTFNASMLKTPEAAIERLAASARHFLRMLDANQAKPAPRSGPPSATETVGDSRCAKSDASEPTISEAARRP